MLSKSSTGSEGQPSSSRQTTLEGFKAVTPLAPNSKRAVRITESIAQFVAKDLRPIAVFEGEGFKSLLSVLDPAYQVPSRKAVKKSLLEKQLEVKSHLKTELGQVEYVALTTDFWTSNWV